MSMIRNTTAFLIIIFLFACHNESSTPQRPRDVWVLHSVLDKHPRMLTLALDSSMYAAYDLAHCTLYKVWKGGVSLEGAPFTNKKNVQPTTWGTDYSDTLNNRWVVEIGGKPDSFELLSKGYRLKNNQIYLKYFLVLSSKDTVQIEERPEFVNDEGRPGFERQFTVGGVPNSVDIALAGNGGKFVLKPGGTSRLVKWFAPLPAQSRPEYIGEYDSRGRYWMEKSDCFTCHEIDRNTVGPSFQEVALKYKDEEGGAKRLIEKVKNGGTGVWGNKVMTPHPNLTENEIKVMLDYVLSLKPAEATGTVAVEAPVVKKKIARPGFGAPVSGVHPSFTLQTIHKSDFNPKVGGIAFLPDGRMLVTTWDSVGAVYMLDNVTTGDTNQIQVKRIAFGLAEPLGITTVGNEIYVLQKQELTRLVDTDGDEIIDVYETICNAWKVTGDFHEFAFGLVYKDGYFYATLSMAMRLMAHEKQQPDRGRTIKIAKDGTYEWINYGLRTPNGIGIGPDNEIFVTDNQGEWEPGNKLIHVQQGDYHGMRWGFLDSTAEPPPVALPAVWLPEDEIANSPSEPVLVKDGPYKGQMLHGDVTFGGVQRDFLEKVNGHYQGAAFHFTQGLEAGINRMRFGPDGALYLGGVGMVGGWSWHEKQSGLQRLAYNGKPVFEMLAVRAKPKGLEVELTHPLEKDYVPQPKDFTVQQWWYFNTKDYGGPKKDLESLNIAKLEVSEDRKHIYIELPTMKAARVVYLRLPEDMKSESGLSLWAGETWYAMNELPKGK
jgi:cytochrome c